MTEMKEPYLTISDVEDEIAFTSYYRFPGTSVTVCCLTFKNGAHFIGKAMCLNPANFDIEKGQKCAREDAVRSAFAPMAYAVLEAMRPEPIIPRVYQEPILKPEDVGHIRWVDGGADLVDAVNMLTGVE